MNAMSFLIAVAPLLVFVAALCFRRYPGEAAIRKLRGLIDAILPAVSNCLKDRGSSVTFRAGVRGGRLIASSLAGRGPPSSQ